MRPCLLCLSPYRNEIVKLHTQGVNSRKIYRKYAHLMSYTSQYNSFYNLIRRHIRLKHKTDAIIIPTNKEEGGITPATIENFGKRMLELGMAKVNTMNAETIQLKDVIQAQKLVLDSKKLKISEDAMMIMMGKLFAPPIDTTQAVEGELQTLDGTGRSETITT